MHNHSPEEHVTLYSDDDFGYSDDSDYGPPTRGKHKCNLCDDTPVFDSLNLYDKHMEESHHPHICHSCNRDFETEDDLVFHKIGSPLHIICVDCHMEFKSQGGLGLHRKQMHKKDSPIECPGCASPFPNASALIQHIEQDLCPGHSKTALENAILTSQVALDKVASVGDGGPVSSIRVLNHVDSAIIEQEKLGMGAGSTQLQQMLGKSQRELTFDEEKQLAQLQRDTWSAYDKCYVCPEPKCRKKFKTVSSIWQHLSTDVHRAKNFRCPGCHNSYKISSALIQHIESEACKAKSMREGKALIKELSGGLVQ